MINEKKELIIIGNGPAGYTASIYAGRYKIDHLIIGKMIGGTMSTAHKICNYPGYKEISGMELSLKMQEQVKMLGTKEIYEDVQTIKKRKKDLFEVVTKDRSYFAKKILLTTGTRAKKLNLPKEKDFVGKGISYCATCDSMFYKEKKVAVIGGNDSAVTAALLLGEVAKKVYLIYRKKALRATQAWVEQVINNKKVEIIYETNVLAIKGKDKLEGVELDCSYKNKKELLLDGLFIEIGAGPENDLAIDLNLEIDKKGYIKVSKEQKTSLEGVYAAGDITSASNYFRQVITACSEGAIAANSIYKEIVKDRNNSKSK